MFCQKEVKFAQKSRGAHDIVPVGVVMSKHQDQKSGQRRRAGGSAARGPVAVETGVVRGLNLRILPEKNV